jgi:hypothetical protein
MLRTVLWRAPRLNQREVAPATYLRFNSPGFASAGNGPHWARPGTALFARTRDRWPSVAGFSAFARELLSPDSAWANRCCLRKFAPLDGDRRDAVDRENVTPTFAVGFLVDAETLWKASSTAGITPCGVRSGRLRSSIHQQTAGEVDRFVSKNRTTRPIAKTYSAGLADSGGLTAGSFPRPPNSPRTTT